MKHVNSYEYRKLLTGQVHLNDVHCQNEKGKHERHNQRQPGPIGGDSENEHSRRYEKQDPVQSF